MFSKVTFEEQVMFWLGLVKVIFHTHFVHLNSFLFNTSRSYRSNFVQLGDLSMNTK